MLFKGIKYERRNKTIGKFIVIMMSYRFNYSFKYDK